MNFNIYATLRIIGYVMMVLSTAMIPAVLVALLCGEFVESASFIGVIFCSYVIGRIFTKAYDRFDHQLRMREGFFIVVVCWIFATVFGALPYILTGTIPSWTDAFFESASGFSTTGCTILTDIESLPKSIIFWRSFTQWIGGIGILLITIALMPALGIGGQNLALSDKPGPTLDTVTPKVADTAKILMATYFTFTIVQIALLMLGGISFFDAMMHTFGTISTGGFSNYNDGISHFAGNYVDIITIIFMILCGINFNLYYLGFKRGLKTIVVDSELKFYMVVLAGTSLFIMLVLAFANPTTPVNQLFIDSLFQVSSILTTTGFTSCDYLAWPMITQTLLLILMFIGGCSSSTSGGIKVVRVVVLLKLIRRGISTRLHPNVISSIRLNGKSMPSDTVTAIANHMFLYISIVFIAAFVVSFENIDITTCFSSVITCLGNIGPGFAGVGPAETYAGLSGLSKWTLSACMIAGRLELYAIFVMLMPSFWNSKF